MSPAKPLKPTIKDPNAAPNVKTSVKIKTPKMITIPEGVFFMGTSDEQIQFLLVREDWAREWYDDDLFQAEQPYHEVVLPAFEIAISPVTNYDYFQFIWSTGYRVPKGWIGFHYPEDTEQNPVTGISRLDANAYITWLNKTLQTTFRLPVEPEWERAARGDEGRIYPWGDDFDPWRCNTLESGKRATTPILSYSPGGDSIFGITDMAGNVWEWTDSILMPYPYDSEDGREEHRPAERYVVRGGSWYYSRKLARCACREGLLETYTSPALGFRLARTPVGG